MRKVMIVDDEADILFLLKTILKRAGYDIVQASNGEECLEKLKVEKPDAIILDIMMPGIDGWETCKKIKEDKSTSSIPVSMLSAKKEPEDIEKSLKYAHADKHLFKPIKAEAIKEEIEELLKKKPLKVPVFS